MEVNRSAIRRSDTLRVVGQPDQRHPAGGIGLQSGTERRERSTGSDRHLEGPDQPAPVGGLDTAGGHRVERRQPGVEPGQGGPMAGAPLGSFRLQLGNQPGLHRREAARERQVVDHRTEVEPGPPDQERPVVPGGDVAQGGPGGGLELLDGEFLRRLHQVDQAVADPGPDRRRRFGGTDVHAPVDGHRVDRHQLDRERTDAAERTGHRGCVRHRHRQLRFPRGGGTHQGDGGRNGVSRQ